MQQATSELAKLEERLPLPAAHKPKPLGQVRSRESSKVVGGPNLSRALRPARMGRHVIAGAFFAFLLVIEGSSAKSASLLHTRPSLQHSLAPPETNFDQLQDEVGSQHHAPAALTANGDKPQLIPLAAAPSGYNENSSVNLLCTISQGHHQSLTFDWFKDGELIQAGSGKVGAPQLEKHPDHSLLRIENVKSQHAGRYTCTAKNQFGLDSSSILLAVNVKLQWTIEPPSELVVSVNQELKVDCLAQGEPKPVMRWEKVDSGISSGSTSTSLSFRMRGAPGSHPSDMSTQAKNQLVSRESQAYKLHHHHHQLQQQQLDSNAGGFPEPSSQNGAGSGRRASLPISSSRLLSIGRARESDAGIYECIASNSHDAELKKLVHVQVRGPPKVLPIATADSYPEGSSVNLICTVSGGQRRGLSLEWSKDGEQLNDERMRYSNMFENLSINSDSDISVLRIKNATNNNSGQYTCTARNPLGQDSTSVKLVINVELKWTKVPDGNIEIGLGQELMLECDALGSPAPTIDWIRHAANPSSPSQAKSYNGTNLVARGGRLKISKAQLKDAGIYECTARNNVDEDLRKVIQIKVRGE